MIRNLQLTSAVRPLALAVVLLGLSGPPASALSIAGSDGSDLSWPPNCQTHPAYEAEGARGAVAWSASSANSSLRLIASGTASAVLSTAGNGFVRDYVVTATDASGATASLAVHVPDYPPNTLPRIGPAPAQYDMTCQDGAGGNYLDAAPGAVPYQYAMPDWFAGEPVRYPGSYDFPYDTVHVFQGSDAVWTLRSAAFVMTAMTIRRDRYGDVSYGPSAPAGSRPTGGWDPADPWAGVSGDGIGAYPFPTPSRVYADGGARFHGHGENGLWPRGVFYKTDDTPLVMQLIEGYALGNIVPDCQNGDRGVWGPAYGYCVGLDYDAQCFGSHSFWLLLIPACYNNDVYYDTVNIVPRPERKPFSMDLVWSVSPPLDGSSPQTTYTRFYAAPTAEQRRRVVADFLSGGVDLSTFTAVPVTAGDVYDAAGNDVGLSPQVTYMIDGTGTFMCDSAARRSSLFLSASIPALNGIHCGDRTEGVYRAPAGILGTNVAIPASAPTGGGAGSSSAAGCPVGMAPLL